MITITLTVETNENNYVTGSTVEYRLFGILLCRKKYVYPPEGYYGEYITT